jgi:hypothetical protein
MGQGHGQQICYFGARVANRLGLAKRNACMAGGMACVHTGPSCGRKGDLPPPCRGQGSTQAKVVLLPEQACNLLLLHQVKCNNCNHPHSALAVRRTVALLYIVSVALLV